MARSTVRLRRAKAAGGLLRGWLAASLVLIAAGAAYFVGTRDLDWRTRSHAARKLGLTAMNSGQYGQARRHFEDALNDNPYDWRTRLTLANLLDQHLDEPNKALLHYLHALAYSPDPGMERETRAKIDILRLMRSGELEDPRNALEDMYVAVEGDARGIFSRRLSARLRGDPQSYWEGWKERGRGRISYRRIEQTGDGTYDAMVELEFRDGTVMAMHFGCSLRDIWRLRTSFP